LLQSTGSLSQPVEEIGTIEGETPDPINVPVGCSFHPRCPIADERCEAENPQLRAPEDGGHHVACFYLDIAADEIPTSITEDE
jgi:oligopeptide/dipeptide ABC transporter ATP-binding protein